ncbi:MAG TPA: cobalamin-binding protein [Peptococcaceae bacterium]|nr:cobalamin-binding protein [Peptococcaceae bacterium]
MVDKDILQHICTAIETPDPDETVKAVEKAVDFGVAPLEIVGALTDGITTLGDKFERMECFLPELILGADAMDVSMKLLKPKIEELNLETGPAGTVVISNIQGDIHDIGRDIVVTMLRVAGYQVEDMGHDVKPNLMIDKALECDADIIAVSTLLTTSLPFAREVLRLLDARGLSGKFKVVMGGGAVTPEYCEEIGAGYGDNAAAAVKLVKELIDGGDSK